MSLFEWQQLLILTLTVAIGVLLHLVYRRRILTSGMMLLLMLVVAHGVAFTTTVLVRRVFLDLVVPSVALTTWSAIWRLHALGTVAGLLYVMLENANE